MSTPADPVTLADWRRRVAELYREVRQQPEPAAAWQLYRRGREALFRHHAQSPLEEWQRQLFSGIPYYDYDPAWRLRGRLDRDVVRETLFVELPAEGAFCYTRVACVHFTSPAGEGQLSLFWVEGYAGGLFLPFRDQTNGAGDGSYGGGRYLLDTIKGADLGYEGEAIVLDFNFAYSPSCAYNDRWVCPLPPAENWLPLAIPAGEKQYLGGNSRLD